MQDQEPQSMDWLLAAHAAKNIPVLQPPQLSTPPEPGSLTLLLKVYRLRGSVLDIPLPKHAMRTLTPSYARWAYALCKTVAQMGVLGVYCSDNHLVWVTNQQPTPSAENVLELNATGLMWMGHFGAKQARAGTNLVECDVLEYISRADTQSWPPEIGTAQMREAVTLSFQTLQQAIEEQARASSS